MASWSYANVGIPMIAIQFPFMLSLLVPVVIIEAALLRQALELRWATATGISLKANLTSTILGCPLAWFLQILATIMLSGLAVEKEILGGLNPYELLSASTFILPFPKYEGKLFWLIPFGGLVGLVPAYFVSVWFEYPFIRKHAHAKGINPKRLMCRVNLLSYALLSGIWLLRLYFNLLSGLSQFE
ncbi:MAG: hypothetical protein D3908_11110 [Candidatus Electrothrix sp. AUS4]|nr:hypothetical protein [Candidatus Electrothrix sp. AUS4]